MFGVVSAMLGLLLVAPAAGQDDAEQQPDDLTKIQVLNVVEEDDGAVVADIAIPGAIGQLAPVEANFGIAFNGQLIDFSVAPLTSRVDVVIAIDTSGSMRGNPLRDAKLAAAAFVEGLPDEAQIGVIGFGETVEVLTPLTTDRSTVLSSIDNLVAVGETRLWDGLVAASEMGAGVEGTVPYVVVLSDGDDSISDASRDDAVQSLSDTEVGLYAVAITSGETTGTALQQAVDQVDGIFTAISESSELDTLYQGIADRLASRYQLSFRRNPSTSGTAVISVAVDSSVATARTSLRSVEAVAEPEPEGPEAALNIPVEAQLGSVPAVDPGVFGDSTMLPIGLGAFFAAIFILGLLVVNPAVDVRLEAAAGADRVAGLNERLSAVADRLVAKRDAEGELDKALDAAGLNLRPGEFLLIAQVIVIVAAMAGWLLGGLFFAFVLAAVAVLTVVVYLNRRASKQRNRFADQLTDTLGILAGSIRAGRGLPQAIELVSTEAPSPTSEQFRRIVFETQVGRDLTQSMFSVAARMKSDEFLWIARAFDINRELGGDLTEILDNIAETIRDRQRINRMVRALSAEGRASGWLMLALPILMFLFMMWRTPDSVDLLLTNSLGQMMLGAGILGMISGFVWIRKLVDLKY
ncbi:MAG: VWA domain-containing protein [Acidimicrobiia bacterium]|nr:VWA domain-containing protein [Acidimicrobiia bacterium]